MPTRDRPRLTVFGADGFVGSHVVRSGLARGWRVLGACVKESPWRLLDLRQDQHLSLVGMPSWWKANETGRITELVQPSEAVVFLAYAPPPGDRGTAWQWEHEVNAEGVARVACIAGENEVPLVFSSSAQVYGLWRDGLAAESSDPAPSTPYAHAKLTAEGAVSRARGVSLRLATVYGLGELGHRAIPSFVRALLAGHAPVIHDEGTDVRDYVAVRDVAEAIITAADELSAGQAVPPVVNVGSGIGRRTMEVLEEIGVAMDRRVKATHVPSNRLPSRLILDPTLAREHLALECSDFRTTLLSEISWLRLQAETGVAVGQR